MLNKCVKLRSNPTLSSTKSLANPQPACGGTRCTHPCHVCLIPIWNSAPILFQFYWLYILDTVHGSQERIDGACNSKHRPVQPLCSHRPRACHALAHRQLGRRMRTLAADVPRAPAPKDRGEGPEATPRLSVAKRRGFHKPDRGSRASFARFFCFSVTESGHHVGPRS